MITEIVFYINETWLDNSIDNREANFDGFIVSRKERTINRLYTHGEGLITLIPYYKLTFDGYVCSFFVSLITKIDLNNKYFSLKSVSLTWLWK